MRTLIKRFLIHLESERSARLELGFGRFALDLGDVDLRQNTIRLHRKGGEVHVMPLAESAKAALKIYLRERRKRNRRQQRKSTHMDTLPD